MTNALIEKIRRTIRDQTKTMKPGSKEAKNAMKRWIAVGLITPKGALAKAYR
jgi:hypothetical protein